jgi:drug/metabolite transporter (DMT)-like permease
MVKSGLGEAGTARLLLILLSFCWGLSWPAMKVVLAEIGPWALRFLSYVIGATTLFLLIRLQGRTFSIPRGKDWLHVIAASMFNVVAFGLFANFAQLMASTSRVVIISNSMPVWGSLMAWMILGERITARTGIGLVFCAVGLTVLVYPVLSVSLQEPVGLLLALGCALSWGGGTIYMKWARIKGDLLAISFWQIAFGIAVFGAGYLIFEGAPVVEELSAATWLGLLYHGILGTGFAYFIWFNIIGRLSTADASLGSLANPVVGVIGSAILLGERPTAPDIIGFALIFAAAACVLIPQRERPVAQTP